ncbi:MAG: ABC transporter substrate-binding protein [Coriobacteriales bacterium]|nr:ABC transporter substrate-binding protein [Coriobacteriales bacterium]
MLKTFFMKRQITTVICSIMILLLLVPLALAGCVQEIKENPSAADNESTKTASTKPREFLDMSGRTITVPALSELKRIYFTGAPAEIYCFTLAPELAGGTTMEYTEAEFELLPTEMRSLNYLGTLSGGKELNPEAIISANIQVIISITFADPTEADKTQADDLQNQTGIPVAVFSGNMERINEVYQELGKLLGKEAEAKKLAAYCEQKLADVKAAVATVPAAQRLKLYYAEGPNGLQTEPETSTHALAYKIAGAVNVADVEAVGGKGMSNISLEQVIAQDPQVIIAWDDAVRGGADELIRTDPSWAPIAAVRDGRVYTMPNVPFSWCDRPPSVNRFLGIQWVANMLYPQAYEVDMVEITKEFYSLFYHVNITDEKAKELLGNSYPVYMK